jgi:hypothetical protein
MTKFAFILSVLVASVSAFAPTTTSSKHVVTAPTTTLHAFEGEIGAQPPLGFFDPLGILDGADQARFNRLRYVELKHGRVCMLAVLGHIVTTGKKID